MSNNDKNLIFKINYLPYSLKFFILLSLVVFITAFLFWIGFIDYSFERLGIRPSLAFILLMLSLFGSYVNIPLFRLQSIEYYSGKAIKFYGVSYSVPPVYGRKITIIAINLGGAVIPALISLYLLIKNGIYLHSLVGIAVVSFIVFKLSKPVPGLGIAVPVFIPPLIAALISLAISNQYSSSLAYISASIGTLLGADVFNMDKIKKLGTPVASIGGAGTFDGIFLSGILAAFFAR